jgi:hypothetical protein
MKRLLTGVFLTRFLKDSKYVPDVPWVRTLIAGALLVLGLVTVNQAVEISDGINTFIDVIQSEPQSR